MSLEKDITNKIERKVEEAKDKASTEIEFRESQRTADYLMAEFLRGGLNVKELKEKLKNCQNFSSASVEFETLPEFIYALRKLDKNTKRVNKTLDHENAHALEAIKRGYNIKYRITFTEENFIDFLITIKRLWIHKGVAVDFFNKKDREPNDNELQEDIVAVYSAPESLGDGAMSKSDKSVVGGSNKS